MESIRSDSRAEKCADRVQTYTVRHGNFESKIYESDSNMVLKNEKKKPRIRFLLGTGVRVSFASPATLFCVIRVLAVNVFGKRVSVFSLTQFPEIIPHR